MSLSQITDIFFGAKFFSSFYHHLFRHPQCKWGADGVQQQQLTLVEWSSVIAGVIRRLAETGSSQSTSLPIIRETLKAEMNCVDKLLALFQTRLIWRRLNNITASISISNTANLESLLTEITIFTHTTKQRSKVTVRFIWFLFCLVVR